MSPRRQAVSDLATSASMSAARLDRLRAMPGAPQLLVDRERVILERRALALLDAARHVGEPGWLWSVEANA